MLYYSRLLHHPPLVGISVFLQSHLQSPFGLSNVDFSLFFHMEIYIPSYWLLQETKKVKIQLGGFMNSNANTNWATGPLSLGLEQRIDDSYTLTQFNS